MTYTNQDAAEHVRTLTQPVIDGFSTLNGVAVISCFGSYAVGTYDQHSDLDLYVMCHPKLVGVAERRAVITQLPEVVGTEVNYAGAAGWESPWVLESDKFSFAQVQFEVSYHTLDWVSLVVREVVSTGAISIPAMPFRPYTLLGLLATALPLYDPQGVFAALKVQLFPYPEKLKEQIVAGFMPIMTEGLEELRDYTKRRVGTTAFLFHLLGVCDAMASVLYALNGVYDPATKRLEQTLRTLEYIPRAFIRRYEALLEGPFIPSRRGRIVDELALLIEEIKHLSLLPHR